MTHDELLAKIGYNTSPMKQMDALRAVVELHKPDTIYGTFCLACEDGRCGNAQSVEYPCPTIQAIEKELR